MLLKFYSQGGPEESDYELIIYKYSECSCKNNVTDLDDIQRALTEDKQFLKS